MQSGLMHGVLSPRGRGGWRGRGRRCRASTTWTSPASLTHKLRLLVLSPLGLCALPEKGGREAYPPCGRRFAVRNVRRLPVCVIVFFVILGASCALLEGSFRSSRHSDFITNQDGVQGGCIDMSGGSFRSAHQSVCVCVGDNGSSIKVCHPKRGGGSRGGNCSPAHAANIDTRSITPRATWRGEGRGQAGNLHFYYRPHFSTVPSPTPYTVPCSAINRMANNQDDT